MGKVIQLELFRVTAADPPWRDNRDAMEFPFLSLQKKRTRPIEYRPGTSVAPQRRRRRPILDRHHLGLGHRHLRGLAFERVHRGRAAAVAPGRLRPLRLPPAAPPAYRRQELPGARRRRAPAVHDDGDHEHPDGRRRGTPLPLAHRLLDPEKVHLGVLTPTDPDGEPDPLRPWEIELAPWLYHAILRQRDILAVHPDYFRLTGGLERWLYRLARKAVPEKADVPAITFRMETLRRQSGTTRALKLFAYDIRKIAETQPLPEYGLRLSRDGKHELVTLYRDLASPGGRSGASDRW